MGAVREACGCVEGGVCPRLEGSQRPSHVGACIDFAALGSKNFWPQQSSWDVWLGRKNILFTEDRP